MKRYRRIEITAFRRRVTIVSGESPTDTQADEDVCINEADTQETIETESEEGQRLLSEAVRVLEEKLSNRGWKEIFTNNAPAEINFPGAL